MIILLARVISKLGTLSGDDITTDVVEGLYSADLSYLQEFYRRINEDGSALVKTACPHCEQEFDFDLTTLGGHSLLPRGSPLPGSGLRRLPLPLAA